MTVSANVQISLVEGGFADFTQEVLSLSCKPVYIVLTVCPNEHGSEIPVALGYRSSPCNLYCMPVCSFGYAVQFVAQYAHRTACWI